MDNCNLEKFNVKPGKIIPKFKNEILNYDVILGVTHSKVVFDFYAEDRGASYQIFVEGGDGSKTIEIAEGSKKIVKIEVTAEDGKTTRTYLINIKRHSSNAAIIEEMKINRGTLIPTFMSDVFEYSCIVGLRANEISFELQLPDIKCLVDINKDPIQTKYSLTMGLTTFKINVTSPNGSNSKIYTVFIMKKYNPYYTYITNGLNRFLYEDAISLSPCITPVKINELYSWDVVMQDEAKQLINLKRNSYLYALDVHHDTENSLSNVEAQILKKNFVLSTTMKCCELGTIIGDEEINEPLCNISYAFHPYNDNINLMPEWQKDLCGNDFNMPEKELIKCYDEALKHYFSTRPTKPIFNEKQIISHESPSKRLFTTIGFASAAVLQQKSQSKYHFILAQLLEEHYLLADLLNVVIYKLTSDEAIEKKPGHNNKVVMSSKQDEILAICRLHGFTGSPTDAEQLKAIDLEYHSLISQNLSSRADAVQNLFEWKSKQATLEGMVSSEVRNDNSLIGQAFNKYIAALSLDKKSCVYNFHVGRLLIMQGKYKEASERFHTALSGNNNHIPSKFCLGLSLSNLAESEKSPNAISLIVEAIGKGFCRLVEEYLNDDQINTSQNKLLMDEDLFFNIQNPLLSKGLLQLGKMLLKTPHSKIEVKPIFIIHWALHLAVGGWSKVGEGNTQIYFESIIVECHKQLLDMIYIEMEDIPDSVCVNRCLWLLNFIQSSSIPVNNDLIYLQEEISKVPIFFDPGNEHFLAYYGQVLSFKADQMIVKEANFKITIETAIKVLHFALDLKVNENADEAAKFIKNLKWYKERDLIIFKIKPKVIEKKSETIAKVTAVVSKLQPSIPQIVSTTKKITQVPKKGPIKPPLNSKILIKESIITKVDSGTKECSKEDTSISSKQRNQISRSLNIRDETKSTKVELLLARAYCINNQYSEAVKYYKLSGIDKNLTKLNDIIQEYIEVLIAAEDINSALDIYLKMPINEKNLSFDDGYICGEVVRLLMKTEKYKDANLIKYASFWAKIFGFAIIEKEIKILEDKNHTEVCKAIYAAVHDKKVNDSNLQMFFQSKCWI